MVPSLSVFGSPFFRVKSSGQNSSPVSGSYTSSSPHTKLKYISCTLLLKGLLGKIANPSISRSVLWSTLRALWLPNFPLIRQA